MAKEAGAAAANNVSLVLAENIVPAVPQVRDAAARRRSRLRSE